MSKQSGQNLDGVVLLQGLTPKERDLIERQCRWKRYDAHEQILDRQSDSHDVHFVVSGRVRIVIYSMAGREITLDDLTQGSHFGELAALDNEPRSASVMALDDVLVAALSQDAFLEMLETHPSMALKLMRKLAGIVRTSTERIMDLSTLGANNRVHAELLRQARLTMVSDNRAEITPIPIHADLASRVSTTRETVARVLNDLARRKILERNKKTLVIQDVGSLEQMVEDVRGE